MPSFRSLSRLVATASLLLLFASPPAHAWGRDGHMLINRLAIENLPTDVPAFLRNGNAVDIIEYIGPEPDRWRNKAEDELSSTQAADHFIDMEWAELAGTPCTADTPGCGPDGVTLPRKRYDFIRALYAAQAKHPDIPLQPDKVGMQPWQVEEVWERLKSDLRDYRRLVASNGDTSGVKTIILFDAGWLGHYVGDGSQPLHATIHYNGWAGKTNPHSYTTEHTIHSQFETVFVTANIKADDVARLVQGIKPVAIGDEWTQYLDYLHKSHALVPRVYELEKTRAFTNAGTPEGKAFADERLAAGAIELRDLIYAAWVHSADPITEYHGPQ